MIVPSKPNKIKAKKLVIVESPAKARTIGGYLGEGFEVEASIGHVRDLPQPSDLPAELKKTALAKFAVDLDNGFEPYYVVSKDKKKIVATLKKALSQADELYLATDEDREGEAIAWHLLQVLQPKVPVHRMVFHEITKEAIGRALENTRELNVALVDAQETRRILDRLYGYELSPVLWRKIRVGLSAGRVQSVATRLVVDRERERIVFRSAKYWNLSGLFATKNAETFSAKLVTLDGKRIATGKDFDDFGQLKNNKIVHLSQPIAENLREDLQNVVFSVSSLDSKPYTRRPAAPFTTSTLQQEAARKLKFSARVTMGVAQSLYENGFITYMRTDSANISQQATSAARAQAKQLYGEDCVPQSPRVYKGKNKNAQEAHEAIRPAGDVFRTPAEVKALLRGDEYRLYDMIWKRTVASQMADAKGVTASVKISATGRGGQNVEFAASGTVITFRGFMAAYEESFDEQRHTDVDSQNSLPNLAVLDVLQGQTVTVTAHETAAPPRYTEASLVKTLEERGIGRPSTYAATISTIMDRGYVTSKGTALVPSWLAFSVIRLLEEHFPKLVDYDFTASMEEDLDKIALGSEQRTVWLSRFYLGDEQVHGLKYTVENIGEIDPREVNSVKISDEITLRVGRYGPYVETVDVVGEEPRRANVPDDLPPDELTLAKALELLDSAQVEERQLGVDPNTGYSIVAKNGRFGAYVMEIIPEPESTGVVELTKAGKPRKVARKAKVKPRTASLFKSMEIGTVTLGEALELMSLPRVLGVAGDGVEVTVQNGRFGPYLKKGTDSRSIESEEQIFSITLEEALHIYEQPKLRGVRKVVPPLAEFGLDPNSQKPILVKDGRFGPYITDGVTNVTVPRSMVVEELTQEDVVRLLADKRARGPVKKVTKKRSVVKKK